MNLKCIIVDDEEMSQKVVEQFVKKTEYLEVSHVLSNGEEAFKVLTKHENPDVDIIFLDIQMPGMSGIELMKKLGGAYQIIFTTSEEKYAVEAFTGSVTDFLVKPLAYDRFLQATDKAKANIEKQRLLAESFKEIFVKSDSRLVCLPLHEIMFVEALADYIIFNTDQGKFIVHHTMKGIERKLPGSLFSRVHRSFIVNTRRIEFIEDMHAHIGAKPIPIGASFKDRLFNKLNLL
ncbi:MAG: LytTR family DNA-binding domain-containing protein [Bacteroidota bacterium]